ncbi:MAG: uridine kinase [Eubacteriales bacterium]|nr:uridine kinase [Eubacteriales bacterium]MDD3881031.1 uridine kinase [Eubacteriales bacterium]MDD4511900.1 uridine kinase [Eubacteriales bacterium]
MAHENFIIGIAGGSGSGKTTFAKRLGDSYEGKVSTISCDNYYRAQDDIPLEKRKTRNYDSPEAFDFDLMFRQLSALKRGEDMECPVYDYVKHTRSSETVTVKSNPVIIIDGILLFTDERLRGLIDLKIYVETDADERIIRRIDRDIRERGRTMDSVVSQYLATVKPMHNEFVEPTKRYADIIINGGLGEAAFMVVSSAMERIISGV